MPVRSTYSVSALSASLIAVFTGYAALAQPADQIRIGTGGPAGVYFVAGNAICRIVRIDNSSTGAGRLRCAAPPSGGSIDNLERLRTGKIDFAIVQSDWHHHAYSGTSRFKSRSNPKLRSVFSLHVEPFQIVVRDDTSIQSWQDLDGKRVNIGNVGSGHRATFEELVREHGQDLGSGRAAVAAPRCDDLAIALGDPVIGRDGLAVERGRVSALGNGGIRDREDQQERKQSSNHRPSPIGPRSPRRRNGGVSVKRQGLSAFSFQLSARASASPYSSSYRAAIVSKSEVGKPGVM